jgi:histidinol-phosphate aminotransferase
VSVLNLARPDLRQLRPYTAGAYEPGCIRLNANESPWRLPSDRTERGLNVYPPPRPTELRRTIAEHYGVDDEQVLVTRGSSEAIDVLIRGFCSANRDGIVVCPPTFDMYRLYAGIQAARVVEAPLSADRDFALDLEGVLAAVEPSTKIVFVCTPNNPTGCSVPKAELEALCSALAGRVLVVIDEAYHEFSSQGSMLALREAFDHVVLLRTMSKFVALAGARCGAVIAAPEVIEFLGNVLPPYTFPTPSIEAVQAALTSDSLRVATERIALIKGERRRLSEALRSMPEVLHVYPSDANFVLAKLRDRDRFAQAARGAGILVRVFDGQRGLEDCVRITVGRPEDNDRLLEAVSRPAAAAGGAGGDGPGNTSGHAAGARRGDLPGGGR